MRIAIQVFLGLCLFHYGIPFARSVIREFPAWWREQRESKQFYPRLWAVWIVLTYIVLSNLFHWNW